MKSLLIEGRYDSLVNQLSRKCVNIIKQSFESTRDGDGKYLGKKISFTQNESAPDITEYEECALYQEEVENTEIPLEFYFEFRLMWIQGLGEVDCDGNAYNDPGYDSDEPPLVEVLLRLDSDNFPNSINQIIAELSDTIRHELEHLTQSGWNTKTSKYIPSDRKKRDRIESGKEATYNYFLLDKEIPAMIHGLYNKAKKSRRPFADVVNDQMQKLIRLGVATPEQTEIIKDKWRSHLPKLAIRQEI
jgi:hypothetical protein